MGNAYDVMAQSCPSRRVLHRIGARWTIFVLTALTDGPMRFVEIKTRISGITPKVLTETLRAMEYDGLIDRRDLGGRPPHVEYELTDLGRSLLVPLATVREWAELHVPDVLAANARHEQESAPPRSDQVTQPGASP